jgi:biopolymer transport protein ExbD
MQFKRKLKKDASIEIASLVDVVFLLLLFFVVTTTFRESPGLEIELPETKESTTIQLDEIVVNLAPGTEMPEIYLGEKKMASFEELEAMIKEELDKRDDDKRTVIVQADKSVIFEHVYHVFDIARSAGASGISLPARFSAEMGKGN